MSIAAPPRGLASLVSPLTGVVKRLDERLLEPVDALLHSYWCETADADLSGGEAAMRAGGGWSATKKLARRVAMRRAVAGWRARKRMASSPSAIPCAT